MKFDFNNIESEREKTQQFAEKNGISEEEIEEIYQEIYEKLPENLTGDKRELRALRKTRGALRKKANVTGTELDGFIIMRFRDKDFERLAWEKTDKYVKENGIEAAQKEGMINDDGKYVHSSLTTQFPDQIGRIINKDNVFGQAVSIVAQDGKQELRFLTIGKYLVSEKIPLCREVSLIVKEGDRAGALFPDRNGYFLNGVKLNGSSNAYYSEEDFDSYTNIIQELCGDIFFNLNEEASQHAQKHANDKFNFIGLVGIVERIGTPLDDGTVPINLELDDGEITLWTKKNIFKNINIEEGIAGIAFVSTYIKQDGTVGYNLGGFLPSM